eukprot:594778-Pleurochrysis_carterae.AAC.2
MHSRSVESALTDFAVRAQSITPASFVKQRVSSTRWFRSPSTSVCRRLNKHVSPIPSPVLFVKHERHFVKHARQFVTHTWTSSSSTHASPSLMHGPVRQARTPLRQAHTPVRHTCMDQFVRHTNLVKVEQRSQVEITRNVAVHHKEGLRRMRKQRTGVRGVTAPLSHRIASTKPQLRTDV